MVVVNDQPRKRDDPDPYPVLDVSGRQQPVRDLEPHEILEHVLARLGEVEGQLKAAERPTRSRGAVRTADDVF